MSKPRQRRLNSSLESCGFVTYILSFPIILIYILWIVIPDETLSSWDVTYYPPKVASILIPTYIIMALLSVPFMYAGINILIMTPHPTSMDNISALSNTTTTIRHSIGDEPTTNDSDNHSSLKEFTIPEIEEIDVAVMNEATFQRRRKRQFQT